MIEPYNAVGLIPTVWGISQREDIFRNIEHHRCNSKWTNWMKDLKNEMYQIIYGQAIYHRKVYQDRAPMKHAEYAEQVTRRQIALVPEKGVWKK